MSLQTLRAEGCRDPGHCTKALAISGTDEITLVIFEMAKADSFSLQVILAGTVAGAFKVYSSNSYNPNLGAENGAQNEAAALNPGNWMDTGSRYLADTTAPAGSDVTTEIHGGGVECAWLKVTLTPASGSGVCDGYLSGKSL